MRKQALKRFPPKWLPVRGRKRASCRNPEQFCDSRKSRNALAAFAALLLSFPAIAAPAGENYRTRLSVVPIDVAMQANVAGQGAVTATLEGNRLTVSGNAEGLRSPATVAEIRRGPPGIPGPVILNLTVTNSTAPQINGTVQLTPSMVQDLKDGQLYVQVNSERAPDGNLRGWLMHTN